MGLTNNIIKMETNYCEEICDDCTQECMKNKIYQEAREIWSKQEKDLIDQIIALNNTIATLKEQLNEVRRNNK